MIFQAPGFPGQPGIAAGLFLRNSLDFPGFSHTGMIQKLAFHMIISLVKFLAMITVTLLSVRMSTENQSSEILPSRNLSSTLEPIGPSKF